MGVLWMKIISIACINVVLINNNDIIYLCKNDEIGTNN